MLRGGGGNQTLVGKLAGRRKLFSLFLFNALVWNITKKRSKILIPVSKNVEQIIQRKSMNLINQGFLLEIWGKKRERTLELK